MYIIIESDIESGLGLLVGSLERTEAVLEVEERLVLLVKAVAHAGDLGLELGDARSQRHGRDLPGQIELLVGIRGNHREYLVGELEVRAHHCHSPTSAALLQHA